MQPFDYTTQMAVCTDLSRIWLPARLELVYQRDRHTLSLGLRTLEGRGWLTLCWHPQAARLHVGEPPPKLPDTFTFSQQLQHQLRGLALTQITPITLWERVLDVQFAQRPGEEPLWHLYVEIMGKYSNVMLVNGAGLVITAAHQVNAQQSRVRTIQTGQPYTPPPSLLEAQPCREESQSRWQERVGLIPGAIASQLLKSYRGLSSSLAQSMAIAAGIDPQMANSELTPAQWSALFERWQEWLGVLESGAFQPALTATGYTVLGWASAPPGLTPMASVQELLATYYEHQANRQHFQQLRHQLQQKLKTTLTKLGHKAIGFRDRLQQADGAETYRAQADLLMAHLHLWQPGLRRLTLADFDTGEPVCLTLDPERNAVQNAQRFYKQHQKLKRSRRAVEPLLAEVEAELHYLEQVEVNLMDLQQYASLDDLVALQEIRDELIQQGYLSDPEVRPRRGPADSASDFYRYTSPSGYVLLVGRNNRQNDQLTFRLAGDYDLWFHTQEIPGSHVLLRLPPGAIATEADLQWAANLSVHHSRARQADQAPVIYTKPQYVFKPKGAKPGMVVYKQEQVLWGYPQRITTYQPNLSVPERSP